MTSNLKAIAKLARTLGMPIDAMEAFFILASFSAGRKEFEASDEDLAIHFMYMIKTGLIQEMFRATSNGANDDDWKSQIENHIAEMEADLSANH